MKVVMLLAAAIFAASVVSAHDEEYTSSDDAIAEEARVVAEHVAAHTHHVGPACGTVHTAPPAAHVSHLAEFAERHLASFQPVTLAVIVHISWSEETRAKSYIPQEKVEAALEQANAVLSGTSRQGSAGTGLAADTGFQLRLHEVKYYKVISATQSAAQGTLTGTQDRMHAWQAANAVDPTKYVNIWVTNNGVGGGRVDYMPWRTLSGGESNPHWGWVQHWGIFPRDNYGSLGYDVFGNYNTGDSLAHEFGHFLNLYHIFNGGCYSISGDYVADTPAESTPHRSTCRNNKIKSGNRWKFRNSCTNQAGNDDVSNIMDYSYDNCRDHFTSGQAAAMQTAIMRYKPKLYAHSLSNSGGGGTSLPAPTDPPTQQPTLQPPPAITPLATCTTIGGANRMRDGTQCAFPFRFKGKNYNGCASIAANDRPYMGKYRRKKPVVKTENNFWCPTVSIYSNRKKRTRHKWGFCACAGATADDMLNGAIGSLVDGGDGISVIEYEDSNDDNENGATIEPPNGGATAAVVIFSTLGTFMIVGLAGVAIYYRQRLHALRASDATYRVQRQESTASDSNSSFVVAGADDNDHTANDRSISEI